MTPANEELLKACREFAEELARDTQTQVSSTAWVYPEMAKPAIEKIAQRLAAFVAERERESALKEWIAAPVHAWPVDVFDRMKPYPGDWARGLVAHAKARIRELSAQEGGK